MRPIQKQIRILDRNFPRTFEATLMARQRVRFESKLVPTYVRRAKSMDAALPWLYLRGISQADTGAALEALVSEHRVR
jgi:hypothetical protein